MGGGFRNNQILKKAQYVKSPGTEVQIKIFSGEPFPDLGDQALREPDGQSGHREEEEEGGAGEGGEGGEQGGDQAPLSLSHQV